MELDELLRGEGLDAQGVEDALAWARRRADELVRGVDGDAELGPLLDGYASVGPAVTPSATPMSPTPTVARARERTLVGVPPSPAFERARERTPAPQAPSPAAETQPVDGQPQPILDQPRSQPMYADLRGLQAALLAEASADSDDGGPAPNEVSIAIASAKGARTVAGSEDAPHEVARAPEEGQAVDAPAAVDAPVAVDAPAAVDVSAAVDAPAAVEARESGSSPAAQVVEDAPVESLAEPDPELPPPPPEADLDPLAGIDFDDLPGVDEDDEDDDEEGPAFVEPPLGGGVPNEELDQRTTVVPTDSPDATLTSMPVMSDVTLSMRRPDDPSLPSGERTERAPNPLLQAQAGAPPTADVTVTALAPNPLSPGATPETTITATVTEKTALEPAAESAEPDVRTSEAADEPADEPADEVVELDEIEMLDDDDLLLVEEEGEDEEEGEVPEWKQALVSAQLDGQAPTAPSDDAAPPPPPPSAVGGDAESEAAPSPAEETVS